jgi:hypothetical protein
MKVNIETAHTARVISRKRFFILSSLYRLAITIVGVYISFVILYKECLHDKECHPVAVGFFALVSLTCFYSAGLPVDKLVNTQLIKK